MGVFAVIAQPNVNMPRLQQAISREFEHDNLPLGDKVWLVAATRKTAREVSDALGITDGASGPAVVLDVSDYYGFAGTDIWGWMKSRFEANG
jgi:hypothetical protein